MEAEMKFWEHESPDERFQRRLVVFEKREQTRILLMSTIKPFQASCPPELPRSYRMTVTLVTLNVFKGAGRLLGKLPGDSRYVVSLSL